MNNEVMIYKLSDDLLVRSREWDMGLVYEAWVPERGGWVRSEFAADVMMGYESGELLSEEQANRWIKANPIKKK